MNSEAEQDRVFDTFELFNKEGAVLFQQQRSIYHHLSREVSGRHVLEAGCGVGIGTAVMGRTARSIQGSDKLQKNVLFARRMYEWIPFFVWDITEKHVGPCEVVVAVEVIEHVDDVRSAVQNLMASTVNELWISTPNGLYKPRIPENPFHVREYSPEEIVTMFPGCDVTIHDWDTWKILSQDTTVDPLVYHVWKEDRL